MRPQLATLEGNTQEPPAETAEPEQPLALSKEDDEGLQASRPEEDAQKTDLSSGDSDEGPELHADGLGTQDEAEDVSKLGESAAHVQEEAAGPEGSMRTSLNEADEQSTSIENGHGFERINSCTGFRRSRQRNFIKSGHPRAEAS